MNGSTSFWKIASLWDGLRILLLFLLVVVYDPLLGALRPVVYAGLAAPSFLQPYLAASVSDQSSPPISVIWFWGKVFGLVSFLFLFGLVVYSAVVNQGIITTLREMQSFLFLGLGITLADLWVLGSYFRNLSRSEASGLDQE
jgi:hypothetical protein